MFHNYSLPHHPKYTVMSLVANPFIWWHPQSWCTTLLGFWAGPDVYHIGHIAPYLWAYKLRGSHAFPYVCSKSLRWYYCCISAYFVLTWFGSKQLRESFTCCKCRCLKQEPIISRYITAENNTVHSRKKKKENYPLVDSISIMFYEYIILILNKYFT